MEQGAALELAGVKGVVISAPRLLRGCAGWLPERVFSSVCQPHSDFAWWDDCSSSAKQLAAIMRCGTRSRGGKARPLSTADARVKRVRLRVAGRHKKSRWMHTAIRSLCANNGSDDARRDAGRLGHESSVGELGDEMSWCRKSVSAGSDGARGTRRGAGDGCSHSARWTKRQRLQL